MNNHITCPRCKGSGKRREWTSPRTSEVFRCVTCDGAKRVSRAVARLYEMTVIRVRSTVMGL